VALVAVVELLEELLHRLLVLQHLALGEHFAGGVDDVVQPGFVGVGDVELAEDAVLEFVVKVVAVEELVFRR